MTREDFEELAEGYGLEVIAFDVLAIGPSDIFGQNMLDYARGALAVQQSGNDDNDTAITLIREPDNPYDELAVKVIGEWSIDGKTTSRHIGYVPKKVAFKIDIETEPTEEIFAFFSSIDNNDRQGFDVKFHVAKRG